VTGVMDPNLAVRERRSGLGGLWPHRPDGIEGRVGGVPLRQWIRSPQPAAHRPGTHVNELRGLPRGEPVTAAPATGESS
jgi:hypothetical protein